MNDLACTLDHCRAYLDEHYFLLQSKDYQQRYPKWPGSVGVELEMLVVDPHGNSALPGLVPVVAEENSKELSLSEVLRTLSQQNGWKYHTEPADAAPMPLMAKIETEERDYFTFEPGGQLEFSSKPYPCLSDAVRRVRSMRTMLTKAFAEHGWALLPVGANPWYTVDEIGLRLPKFRYQAMDQYFSSIGPFGRQMMRQTSSLQVCLDFGAGEALLAKRYLVSQLISPFAVAIFANSPYLGRECSAIMCQRSYIWQQLDPSRTGFPDLEGIFHQLNRHSCLEAYLDFLLDASVIYIKSRGHEVPAARMSFRQWMAHGYKGIFPSLDDFITHASLQFPEVRPRGFMEIRSVDAQATPWQITPAAFFIGLLYDEDTLERAYECVQGYRHELATLRTQAKYGMSDPRIARTAQELMRMACAGFARVPDCFRGEGIEKALYSFAEHFTMQGMTPAAETVAFVKKEGGSYPTFATYQALEAYWQSVVN